MTPEPKLLPCPFCGVTPRIVNDENWHWINCGRCGTNINGFSNRDSAISKWNTRTTPPLSAPVAAFARKMDAALAANMHKGTREEWRKRNPYFTSCNVSMQGGAMAVMVRYEPPRDFELSKFTRSAVNAAVYAMMAADACGGLESEEGK